MRVFFLGLFLSVFLFSSVACSNSKKASKTETPDKVKVSTKGAAQVESVVINTSAQCGMCQSKIEGALKKVGGVKAAALDMKTKAVTVKYDAAQTSPDALRTAIAALGYDADSVAGDAKAYKALPKCCQKGGHE